MANDLFNLSSLSPGAINEQGYGSVQLDTGDLRRAYNFGNRVSELSIAQDPFFRFLSKVAKTPTNDPSFKFTERRHSFHKRYAYVAGSAAWSAGSATGLTYTGDESVVHDAPVGNTANDTYALKMGTDYKSAGNITNIIGQTNGSFAIGSTGTAPQFFIVDSLLRVPVKSVKSTDGAADTVAPDYQIVKIKTVEISGEYAYLGVQVVRPHGITPSGSHEVIFSSFKFVSSGVFDIDTAVVAKNIAEELEPMRSYVVGSAHAMGSGFPQTWKDQPFSLNFGQTQIWKTAMAMDNTARATELKYETNEWSRIWKEKLIEHKWDIETDLLFGTQHTDPDGVTYTQGVIDYVLNKGNIFSLDYSTKTQDDFLEDMSQFLDPRYNYSNATLFMVDTATYNWLHKLSGYFANNVGNLNAAQAYGSRTPTSAGHGRADFAVTGKKKVFGVDITTISTPYGDMNISRNVHLDSSDIKILGVCMKYVKYRPLVGNGLNRDTTVYVGVQTLENSGIDRRVDIIQTEAGMEFGMPECHVLWK